MISSSVNWSVITSPRCRATSRSVRLLHQRVVIVLAASSSTWSPRDLELDAHSGAVLPAAPPPSSSCTDPVLVVPLFSAVVLLSVELPSSLSVRSLWSMMSPALFVLLL
ncbi:hypothetical protein GN244_ATG10443 [Phytophthora infestans]|uniref:Uncharacterized protein n=1 Tax=Phytophthora infestans TaxID=4787 RepID=A0A833WU49_PHYIN|nr:hypothetical protein GN244_ATG10443 [Phytophthora infestans]KAF4146600.1 hypothetical protein GN958_ATG04197 [Phytophthora infestans]